MFTSICSLAFVFAGIAQVNALVVPRATPPQGWDTSALEPYDTYHCRYLAVGCQYQHGTSFFDTCCHPLQANQSASSLPSECQQPSNTTCSNGEPVTASSPAVSPTAQPATETTPTAQPAGETTPTPQPAGETTPTPTPTPTSTPSTTTPTPTPTQAPANAQGKPTTTTSSTAQPAATSGNSMTSSSLNYGGYATYFYQNGNAGACGQVHSDSDYICAMDQALFGDSGNGSPLCGMQVQITNINTGAMVTVTVADDCPTCANANSIDLSVAAFEAIASLSEGEVAIAWQYV
ncbi:plant expansin [Pisolithus orientalis]|uniref:plant expansin n=1 Tax=Pisolithus orientalis TaxID=936130 RepID=UPI0022256B34|nr:plant expansin [Pisolithus orientalis]KAI6028724.1 plant expansin [Pisolithus orientalis]